MPGPNGPRRPGGLPGPFQTGPAPYPGAVAMMGASGTARVAMPQVAELYASIIPEWLKARATDWFSYNVDILGIVGLGTGTGDIAIESDSDFLLVTAAAFIVDPAGPTVIDPALALLTASFRDTGSGRLLQNTPSPVANVFGTGQLPCVWDGPKLIDRASTFSTTIANLTAATTLDVRLSYRGIKVFNFDKDVNRQ